MPKILWIYSDSEAETISFRGVESGNHQHYAQKSGFEVRELTDTNYPKYLPTQTATKLHELTSNFVRKTASSSIPFEQLSARVRVMIRRMVALHVLEANGGIILQQSLLLAEDLKWVNEVYHNPYVNRLNRSNPTKVVGFFDPQSSGSRTRHDTD